LANAQKTCWTVVLFFLVMAAIPSLSDEGPRTKLFLKSGTVITCDQVWEGMGSGVFCQKSRGILVYWAEEIDFVKTFGASDVNETGAPYERIKREKEGSSMRGIPQQKRAMRTREMEEMARKHIWTDQCGRDHLVTREMIAWEKRRLEAQLQRELPADFINHIHNTIRALEQNPARYFSKKNEYPDL
jgi:hypothetical protein